MFRRKRKASDYSAEIEAHIELETEALREQGLSQEEAHAAARRAFGNVTRAQERFYESSHWRWMDHLARDIRYGLRMLRHSPGFTVVAVLTIALGVGATTAIFSIVDATLLHPLPYANPEQLVRIHDDLPGVGSLNVGMSTREWWDLERSGVFESVSPEWYDDNNLTGSSEPSRVRLLIVALFCRAWGEAAVRPHFQSRGSHAWVQSGMCHQRWFMETRVRRRPAHSGEKPAAG